MEKLKKNHVIDIENERKVIETTKQGHQAEIENKLDVRMMTYS